MRKSRSEAKLCGRSACDARKPVWGVGVAGCLEWVGRRSRGTCSGAVFGWATLENIFDKRASSIM